MKTVEIYGIVPPIITPMNEDESVNYEELRNQIDRLIDNGCHGIFVTGTNGESYILSEEEKLEILRVAVEHINGRVPVYSGTGCISTSKTIKLSLQAMQIGADVLSIITPSFAVASQEELYIHYETIAKAVDMPIVLYNIPARTGNSLATETVQRLAKIENIVGVKDSSGNFDNMLKYIEYTRDIQNFEVVSGNDSLILWNLYAGGAGGVSGCANVYPKTMSSIYDYFKAGELKKAREMQDSIRSFRNCFKYGNPNTIVKTAVKLLGHDVGKCRAPFNSIAGEGIDALKAVLKENEEKGMR